MDRVFHSSVVLCLRHLRPAPAVAVANVVIEAGPFFPNVSWKFPSASWQAQGVGHCADNLPAAAPAAVGAKVAGSIFRNSADQGKTRISLVDRKADIGIAFVIFQQNIIARLMPLNQRALQHQSFKLIVRQNIVKVVDLADHGPGLPRMAGEVGKVLADPIFQRPGFPYIDHLPRLVHHNIDAGGERQRLRLLFQFLSGHKGLLTDCLSMMKKAPQARRFLSLTFVLTTPHGCQPTGPPDHPTPLLHPGRRRSTESSFPG